MKPTRKYLILISLLVLLFPLAAMARGGRGGGQGHQGKQGQGRGSGSCEQAASRHLDALPKQAIDANEREGLRFTREEEKLARDVYLTLYLDWDRPIFTKIARAEQRHMDAMSRLLERYDIEDPVVDDAIGSFTNPVLAELFEELVAKGKVSVEAALEVGATIEDLDIFDIEGLIEGTDNDDLSMVYRNLSKGSRNHMRAFTTQLELYDIDYEAQYLSAEELTEIIESEKERRIVYDENGEILQRCGKGRR